MNETGHKETLVASQPGNSNAVRHGVYSPRVIEAAANELEERLLAQFEFTPTEQVAVGEVARLKAILAAIDRDLDERGFEGRNGKTRYLVGERLKFSRQLERWSEKIAPAIDRRAAQERVPARVERSDLIRGLQEIACSDGPDRFRAIDELLRLREEGSAIYLEARKEFEADKEYRRRGKAIEREKLVADFEQRERAEGPIDLLFKKDR